MSARAQLRFPPPAQRWGQYPHFLGGHPPGSEGRLHRFSVARRTLLSGQHKNREKIMGVGTNQFGFLQGAHLASGIAAAAAPLLASALTPTTARGAATELASFATQ